MLQHREVEGREKEKKLKISTINIQSLRCVKSWCFGSHIGRSIGGGKREMMAGDNAVYYWLLGFRHHTLKVSGGKKKASKFQANKSLYCFDSF